MSVLDRRRGEIGLGDVASALRSLRPADADDVASIAGVLGFGLRAADLNAQPAPTPAIYDHQRPLTPQRPQQTPSQERLPGWAMPPLLPAPEPLPDDVLPSQIFRESPLAGGGEERPAWLGEAYRLLPQKRATPPRHALLPARTARGVLVAALATWRTGSEIDVAELTRLLAEQRMPQRLPSLPVATLERGCQLLLDFSDSMVPWWEDLRELAQQAIAVLGDDLVSAYEFAGTPAEAQRWDVERDRLVAWRPEAERPILVATDFGIRGTPSLRHGGAEWRAFVARCVSVGAPLLFFVPWSRGYWPSHLGLHPQIVHWHPATSAAMLRRQRGLSRRVAR